MKGSSRVDRARGKPPFPNFSERKSAEKGLKMSAHRSPLTISLTPADISWLSGVFMPARGLSDISLAVESLIHLHRSMIGDPSVKWTEPAGQAVVREALGRSGTLLTVRRLAEATGLTAITVRAYVAKLAKLGHVVSKPVKTQTCYAEAYELSIAGRRVWASTLTDPEERAIEEETILTMERRAAGEVL